MGGRARVVQAALVGLLVAACSPDTVTEEVTEITVDNGDGQFGLLTVAILLLVVVIVALIAVIVVLASRRPPPPPVAPPPPPPTTPPPPPVLPEEPAAERPIGESEADEEEEWEWVDEDDPRWAEAEEWPEEDER